MDFSLQLFITHSIGFLITVWILKKYAWGPILSMLDERRNKIKGEFEKIENGHAEVEKLTARKINEKAKSEIEQDVAKAKVQLKDDMVSLTIAAASKIINEKLDDEKHRQLIANFIDGVEKV